MKNKFRCITAAIVCAILCALPYKPAGAITTLSGKALEIPSEYGITKEVFQGQSGAPGKEQIIIHLQDAHCNYEAQKNLAKVLEYLVKEYNLRLIMVEGGSGNVNLSFLRSYVTNKELREQLADKYLKLGKISGEEYLDLVSDYNLELYGIEDKGLYDANLAAFFKVDPIRNEGLKYLQELSRMVEALKPYIYGEQLNEWEKKSQDYEQKVISLAQYCQYFKEAALMQGISLDDYYHIATYAETAKYEKDIDFKQAESQRNDFIKQLANLLDEAGVEELISKSREFKAKEISAYKYYSSLEKSAEGKVDIKSNYPQLADYIYYIKLSGDIQAEDILKEINLTAEKIKEHYLTNDDQRRLSNISKSLGILTQLLNLELTPEDYEYFKANRSGFSTSSWVNFLNEKSGMYNLNLQASSSNVVDDNLKALEEFYQLGLDREESFIRNVSDKMSSSGEKIAVLITGGFHTPGISRMLKEQGFSYMVVAPLITQKSDSSIYFSVLRGGQSLEESLQK